MNAIYNLRFFFVAFYVNSSLLCWNEIFSFRNSATSFKSLKTHLLNELTVSLLMMCNFCRKLLFHFKFQPRMRKHFYCLEIFLTMLFFRGDKNDEFNNTHAINVTRQISMKLSWISFILFLFLSFWVSLNSSRESKVIFHKKPRCLRAAKLFSKEGNKN